MSHRVIKILIALICQVALAHGVQAQNTFKVIVSDSATGEKIAVAVVVLKSATNSGRPIGAVADRAGYAEIKNVPDGDQIFIIDYLGYQREMVNVHFPQLNDTTYKVRLAEAHKTLNDLWLKSSAKR